MIDVRALGYVVVQSAKVETWRDYAENVLGMQAQDAADGALYLKMDERDFRYLVVPGDADRYFASGWELADAAAFDNAIRALESSGVEPSAPARKKRRCAACRRWCGVSIPPAIVTNSSGACAPISGASFRRWACRVSSPGQWVSVTPFCPRRSSTPPSTFCATCSVSSSPTSSAFSFTDDPAEPEKRIHFLHCRNARHHSLAIMDLAVPSGCIHVMAEVDSMDEVGRALDRVAAQGVKLSATLGRHCNDHMISFYMKTPGGFDLEYGYGGLTVDWAQHSVYEATA